MGASIRLPLIGGAYKGRSAVIDSQTMVNYYVEGDATTARGARYAVPTPGITQYNTTAIGTGVTRGVHYYEGKGIVTVVGNTVYLVTDASHWTTITGTMTSSTGWVQMVDNGAANGHQVLIVDDVGDGYVYDSNAATLTKMTNATNGWPSNGVGSISWQDGYGLLTELSTGEFWWTNAYDFTTINGLNFATAEGAPDNLVAVISDGVRSYLLGTATTEVWYDQGLVNQAFARLPGALYYKGAVAPRSAAVIDNSIVWLGRDKNGQAQVLQARGTNPPVAISTTTIEYWFNQYTTISDAFAFTYEDQGHLFYVLTFPTADQTWVWDATTQQWAERSTNGIDHAWFPVAYTYDSSQDKHFVINGTDGHIYYIDRTATTDAGTAITREITSPYIVQMHDRTFGNAIEVMTNAGTAGGPTSGTITLSWSKDNDQTFTGSTTFTLTSSSTQRLIFRRLGWARQWVFKISTTTNAIIFDLFGTPMQIAHMPAFPSTEVS